MNIENENEQQGNGLQTTDQSQNGVVSKVLKSNATVIEQNGAALMEICMQSIEKIKENPGYIPQAEAISNQVKQIVDIAKTQIDGIRVSNNFGR